MDDNDEDLVAERILEKRYNEDDQLQFLIKWQGESEEYATWESFNEVTQKWSHLLHEFNLDRRSNSQAIAYDVVDECYPTQVPEYRMPRHAHHPQSSPQFVSNDDVEARPSSSTTTQQHPRPPAHARAQRESRSSSTSTQFYSPQSQACKSNTANAAVIKIEASDDDDNDDDNDCTETQIRPKLKQPYVPRLQFDFDILCESIAGTGTKMTKHKTEGKPDMETETDACPPLKPMVMDDRDDSMHGHDDSYENDDSDRAQAPSLKDAPLLTLSSASNNQQQHRLESQLPLLNHHHHHHHTNNHNLDIHPHHPQYHLHPHPYHHPHAHAHHKMMPNPALFLLPSSQNFAFPAPDIGAFHPLYTIPPPTHMQHTQNDGESSEYHHSLQTDSTNSNSNSSQLTPHLPVPANSFAPMTSSHTHAPHSQHPPNALMPLINPHQQQHAPHNHNPNPYPTTTAPHSMHHPFSVLPVQCKMLPPQVPPLPPVFNAHNAHTPPNSATVHSSNETTHSTGGHAQSLHINDHDECSASCATNTLPLQSQLQSQSTDSSPHTSIATLEYEQQKQPQQQPRVQYGQCQKNVNFQQIKQGGAPFACPFCTDTAFENWHDWKQHWYDHHNDDYFKHAPKNKNKQNNTNAQTTTTQASSAPAETAASQEEDVKLETEASDDQQTPPSSIPQVQTHAQTSSSKKRKRDDDDQEEEETPIDRAHKRQKTEVADTCDDVDDGKPAAVNCKICFANMTNNAGLSNHIRARHGMLNLSAYCALSEQQVSAKQTEMSVSTHKSSLKSKNVKYKYKCTACTGTLRVCAGHVGLGSHLRAHVKAGDLTQEEQKKVYKQIMKHPIPIQSEQAEAEQETPAAAVSMAVSVAVTDYSTAQFRDEVIGDEEDEDDDDEDEDGMFRLPNLAWPNNATHFSETSPPVSYVSYSDCMSANDTLQLDDIPPPLNADVTHAAAAAVQNADLVNAYASQLQPNFACVPPLIPLQNETKHESENNNAEVEIDNIQIPKQSDTDEKTVKRQTEHRGRQKSHSRSSSHYRGHRKHSKQDLDRYERERSKSRRRSSAGSHRKDRSGRKSSRRHRSHTSTTSDEMYAHVPALVSLHSPNASNATIHD